MPDARAEYGDIIDLEHPVSEKHPQMPRSKRAVQFAPFAALTGYDDLIRESERQTERERELDEDQIRELNEMLVHLLRSETAPEASFTVFVPDGRKTGGKYVTLTGRISRFDEYARSITLDSGEVIRIESITQIECTGR